MPPLLEVEDLTIAFPGAGGQGYPVDGLDFTIEEQETVCIVGESGCGKTLSALSILQLLPVPPAKVERGCILFKGQDLLRLPEREIRRIRGQDISMIFQEPMTSLNPVMTVGEQIAEVILEHKGGSRSVAVSRAAELLDLVRIPNAKECVHEYPHRLSGGMRQRVMIAMALACEPDLLIADEPTTALDVTIQAEVLDLIASLQREFSMSVLLITHDLGVVARMAERVIVMYAGKKVEEATTTDLFGRPLHPYTQGLMRATPTALKPGDPDARLNEIPGMVPSFFDMPRGCPFVPRCDQAVGKCQQLAPSLVSVETGRTVSCFVAQGDLE